MVTFLDLGLADAFSDIFVFIFIWAIVFSIFQKKKVVTDSPAINAIIATAVGILSIISDIVTDIIATMIPYAAIAIIALLVLLLIFQIFGATEDSIFKYAQGDRGVWWVLMGIGVAIFAIAAGQVLGQQFTDVSFEDTNTTVVPDSSVASPDFEQNLFGTFTNPKVLGLVVILAIGIFAVGLLTSETPPRHYK